MDKYKLPEGLKDYLPEECYMKNAVISDIMDVFQAHAYTRVETPALEYFNLYNQGAGRLNEEFFFKVIDNDGRIMVLRPDITMPISRIVSTKVKPKIPLKYCYLGNCFNTRQDKYKLREFTQAGVELVNEPSIYADAEVISLAVEALIASGLDDFLIDIGQVEYCRGIINSLAFTREERSLIARHIYRKDIIGLAGEMGKNLKDKDIELLSRLPGLFGGEEIFDAAEQCAANDDSLEALDELRQLNELLKVKELDKYIAFDLSLVNDMNYYSGVVFKGMTKHFGAPILAGGRYDGLSAAFGADIPSTGFAIGVDNLLTALQRAGKLPEKLSVDYVIGYDAMGYDAAIKAAGKLISDGYIVDTVYTDSEKSLIKYQEQKGGKCGKLIYVGNKKEDK